MFIIVGTHDFYGPSTREIIVDQVVTDKDGNDMRIKFFETREAAEAYIAELDGERYYLMHDESGSPSYRVEDADWEFADRDDA